MADPTPATEAPVGSDIDEFLNNVCQALEIDVVTWGDAVIKAQETQDTLETLSKHTVPNELRDYFDAPFQMVQAFLDLAKNQEPEKLLAEGVGEEHTSEWVEYQELAGALYRALDAMDPDLRTAVTRSGC